MCTSQAPAAKPRTVPVTDCIGEVTSLFGWRTRRDRIACVTGGRRLSGEELTEPPPIVQCAGQTDRLGEVRIGCLGSEDGDDYAVSSQRPRQQRRVIDLARDREGLLNLINALLG